MTPHTLEVRHVSDDGLDDFPIVEEKPKIESSSPEPKFGVLYDQLKEHGLEIVKGDKDSDVDNLQSGIHDFSSVSKPTDLDLLPSEDGTGFEVSRIEPEVVAKDSGAAVDKEITIDKPEEVFNFEDKQIPTAIDIAMKKTEGFADNKVEEEVVAIPPLVEKEKTAEEINADLERSRSVYAEELVKWKNEIRKKKNIFSRTLSDLGIDKQLPETEEPEELVSARNAYVEAKKIKNKSVVSGVLNVPNKDQRPLGILEAEAAENREKIIASFTEENDALQKRIMENIPPLEKGRLSKALEKWSSLSPAKRLVISTAILTLSVGMLTPAGALAYGGMRLVRGGAGAVASESTRKLVDFSADKWNKYSRNKTLDEYVSGLDLDSFSEKEKQIMRQIEREGDSKKRQRLYKALAMAGVGGAVTYEMGSIGNSEAVLNAEELPNTQVKKPELSVSNDFGNVDKHLGKLEMAREGVIVPSILEIPETKIELSPKGFIQDIHNLKASILAEYTDKPIPEALQKNILDKSSLDLAKQFNFYDPETNASGVGLKGESLGVDSHGNVFYDRLDGTRQMLFESSTGKVNEFSGEMITKDTGNFVDFAKNIYPNGEIGDRPFSNLDFGGNKPLSPDTTFVTDEASVPEVLESKPVLSPDNAVEYPTSGLKIEKEVVYDGKTFGEAVLPNGSRGVVYEGVPIAHEEPFGKGKMFVLDDAFQEDKKFEGVRSAYVDYFENSLDKDSFGPKPIAESFEGGKIYVSFNAPDDPNNIRILLNGKQIAIGSMADAKGGIPKISLDQNLKSGWFLADNAYERAFKHINKMIKAGSFKFI